MNYNHPTLVKFLEIVSTAILSKFEISNYFTLPKEKKSALSYLIFKELKTSSKRAFRLTDLELRSMITVLCKRSEEQENYEFAAALNDILKNFELINEPVKPVRRKPKNIKTTDV